MNESLKKYIWKKEFDVTDWTEGDKHKIVLREPNTAEFRQLIKIQGDLVKDDSGELIGDVLENFVSICCTIIIDHDFYEGDNNTQKLASKDVAEFIGQKLDLAKTLLTEYMSSLPLLEKKSRA